MKQTSQNSMLKASVPDMQRSVVAWLGDGSNEESLNRIVSVYMGIHDLVLVGPANSPGRYVFADREAWLRANGEDTNLRPESDVFGAPCNGLCQPQSKVELYDMLLAALLNSDVGGDFGGDVVLILDAPLDLTKTGTKTKAKVKAKASAKPATAAFGWKRPAKRKRGCCRG